MTEHPGKIDFCNFVKMKTQKGDIIPNHRRPTEPRTLGTFVKLGSEKTLRQFSLSVLLSRLLDDGGSRRPFIHSRNGPILTIATPVLHRTTTNQLVPTAQQLLTSPPARNRRCPSSHSSPITLIPISFFIKSRSILSFWVCGTWRISSGARVYVALIHGWIKTRIFRVFARRNISPSHRF
jgi:hypothetical protein